MAGHNRLRSSTHRCLQHLVLAAGQRLLQLLCVLPCCLQIYPSRLRLLFRRHQRVPQVCLCLLQVLTLFS